MKIITGMLLALILLGAASCVITTYPDDERYRSYGPPCRGYPEGYFSNLPGWEYCYDSERYHR